MTSILVVDDSAMDRRIVGGLLEKQADWSVLYAEDGRRALDLLESELPDLVVTDLQMPHLSGLQLVERIKVDFPLIPVVLMTGAGSENVAVEALQKGAASYVPKKELAVDLVGTVKRLLALSEDRRVHRRLFNYLTEVHYVLENDLQLISALASDLRRSVQERGLLLENECLCTINALDEALANAYFHGNLEVSSQLREQDAMAYYDLADQRRQESPFRERRIYVNAQFGREQLTFTVRDEGPGFDPMQIPDPTAPEFLERPCGRGIFLMRAFVDDVRFSPDGNQITLVKRTRWCSGGNRPDGA